MAGKQGSSHWESPTLVPLNFQAGGVLSLDALYVERRTDSQLYDALRQGNMCHVLAPRQMGKSSLLLRCKDKLLRQGWICIDLDLQIFATDSDHQFYGGVMDRLARELGLYWDPAKFRQRHLESPLSYLWVSFLIDHLLPARRQNLAIFVDDIDSLTRLPSGASEFLLGLRTAIERSADMSAPAAAQRALFSVCVAGVTQLSELIKDPRGSLNEISRTIELTDFTTEETRQLMAAMNGISLYSNPQYWLDAVIEWTGGHPYLTQKLCADLAAATPTAPSNYHPSKSSGRKLIRKEVGARVHRLLVNNRESYVQGIKDELATLRGTQAYRDLISAYRQVYISGPGRLVEWSANDLAQQSLLRRCLVKKQVHENRAAATTATILVLRNNAFREIFGGSWLAQQEHPALAKLSDKMLAFFQANEAPRLALTYDEVQSLIELSIHHDLTLGKDFTSYIARSAKSRRRRRNRRVLYALGFLMCVVAGLGLAYRQFALKQLLGQKKANLEREVTSLDRQVAELTAKETELEEQVSSLNLTIGTFSTEEKTLNEQIELQKQKVRLLKENVATIDRLALSAKKNSRETMKVLRQKVNETADSLQLRITLLTQRIDELKTRAAGQQAMQKRFLEELTAKDRALEAALGELAAKRSPGAQELPAVLGRASRSFEDAGADKPWSPSEAGRELRLALDGRSPLNVQLPFVERGGVDGARVALCMPTSADSGAFVSIDGQQLHLWTAASLESATKKPQLLGTSADAQYAAALGACNRGVVANATGKLAVWDARSVRPIKTSAGSTKLLALVPVADGELPDGLPLLSGGSGPQLARYLLKDQTLKSAGDPLVHESAVTRAVLSRDGAWVLSAADRRLYVWDFATGKALPAREAGHEAAITALAMSLYDDGSTVVSGSSQGEIKKWTRSKEGLLLRRTMSVHQGAVLDVVLAEGGRYIISAGSDGYIIWTDPRDGKKIYKLGPFEPVGSGSRKLAVSLDGSRLLIGFPDKVRMYSIGDRDFLRLACQTLQSRPGSNPAEFRAACEKAGN